MAHSRHRDLKTMRGYVRRAKLADAQRRAAIAERRSFTTETVFSHPSRLAWFRAAKEAGYRLYLHVILVPEELAVRRVAVRVEIGGHGVPEVMDAILTHRQTPDQAARAWLAANDTRVRAWLADTTPMPGAAAARQHGTAGRQASSFERWLTAHKLPVGNAAAASVEFARRHAGSLFDALSRDADTSHIPVLIVSTKNLDTDKMWGLRQGAKDYIVKPPREKDLIERINALVGH